MSIIWDTIYDNFKSCIENSATGVNSLTSVNTSFAEGDTVDLKSQPSSIINGLYSIQMDNINSVNQDLGSGVTDFNYDIRIQIAFEISTRSNKEDYVNAINDTEELIRHRLKYSTFQNTSILSVEFRNATRFQFFDSEELERFTISELVFNIKGRTNLNS
jgi:hypothetical protein